MLVSDLIADARVLRGWNTDARIAEALGVEPQRLYQWKTHRRPVPAAMLNRLAILAGRDVEATAGRYCQEWQTVKAHPELRGSR